MQHFIAVLPLFVHITSERNALSADRVYDLHCSTFGSRPSALVTWWLGTTQLLDHSSQVRRNCWCLPQTFSLEHHGFDNWEMGRSVVVSAAASGSKAHWFESWCCHSFLCRGLWQDLLIPCVWDTTVVARRWGVQSHVSESASIK